MCCIAVSSGSTPCQRHTTIGVSQISHSAIQQTSSSWNQCVILAASHRSQSSTFSPWGMAQNVQVDTVRSMDADRRSEEHTSELQSLMRISYAAFCLKKTKTNKE